MRLSNESYFSLNFEKPSQQRGRNSDSTPYHDERTACGDIHDDNTVSRHASRSFSSETYHKLSFLYKSRL